jgi:hypothetical protein
MPADLSQSPLIGRWAGTRVLVQGDYAEDDDLPGWDGQPLSKLYSALRDKEDEEPDPGQPVFADISEEVAAFLEEACSVRFFKASWGSSYCVAVKPVARALGGNGVAAAPSLVRALRDARGALLFATGTSLNQCRTGVPFACRSGVPIARRLTLPSVWDVASAAPLRVGEKRKQRAGGVDRGDAARIGLFEGLGPGRRAAEGEHADEGRHLAEFLGVQVFAQ